MWNNVGFDILVCVYIYGKSHPHSHHHKQVVYLPFPVMGGLCHCFTHITGVGVRPDLGKSTCDWQANNSTGWGPPVM